MQKRILAVATVVIVTGAIWLVLRKGSVARQGATEYTTVCKALLEDLVARGLDQQRRYLFVLDGSKALRAAVEKVVGDRAEVQRCQLHKRRNLKDHLPKECQADYDRQLRNAYAMASYEEAKAALEKIFRQLERINPSAARSLEEGMEETLTLHRLGWGRCCAAAWPARTSSSPVSRPCATWRTT